MNTVIVKRNGRPQKSKSGWIRRAIGEMASRLKSAISSYATSKSITYKLNSGRVDYELSKQLYRNINDDYKLGAGFARPIINATVGFMGVPRLKSEGMESQRVLDDHFGRWSSRMIKAHRNAIRDGDYFYKLTRVKEEGSKLYKEDESRIELSMIPANQIIDIMINPNTGEVDAYVISYTVLWGEIPGGKKDKKYKVLEVIGTQETKITREGDTPKDLQKTETIPNEWGFVPIVHLKNEAEDDELFGSSDLEAVEPFLKAYHDVMIHGLSGSKLHSVPKLLLKLNDVDEFIMRNFSIDVNRLAPGETPRIDISGQDAFLLRNDEDAQYLEVTSAIGSTEVLLKFLFMCIVDASETPEFAFGTAVQSSKASVSEQMTPLVKKIIRKRAQFEESYQMLARILLAMHEISGAGAVETYETWLEWDEIVAKDEKQAAEVIKTLIESFSVAIDIGLMGLDSAVNYLAAFVPTMMEFISDDPETPGERERIFRTQAILKSMREAETTEQKAIMEELKKMRDAEEQV